jgi:hypothetical protein
VNWDGEALALTFASPEEAEAFHQELSALLRMTMVQATRHVEDPEKAKAFSRLVMQDHATVMRALNALRTTLTRQGS